ncbi:MAG: hypothetical protein N3A66_06150, partial [Planctomycetota bacterium]|nr:hypothetical protein [Planctomycetota bacterium]
MCASKIVFWFCCLTASAVAIGATAEEGLPAPGGPPSPAASRRPDEWRDPLPALSARLRAILEKGELPPLVAEADKISALRAGRSSAVETFRRWREHLRSYTAALRDRHDYEDLTLIARCYDDPLGAPEKIEAWSRELVAGPAGLATALAEVDRLLAALPAAKSAKHIPEISAPPGIEKFTKYIVAAAERLDKQALRRVRPKERELMEFVLPWLCRSSGVFGDKPKRCPVYRLMWAFLPSDEFQPGDSVTRRAQVAVPPAIKSMTGIGRYLRALAGKPTSVCFLEEKGFHPSFACAVDFAALQEAWQMVAQALRPENLAALCREAATLEAGKYQIRGISGEVLAATETPYGYIAVAGAGDNRYEDAPILALIDLGGNDTYIFRRPAETLGRRPLQIIVDLAGDDLYQTEGVGGPGAGVLGIGVLIDRQGSDRYCQGLSPDFMPQSASRQTLGQKDSDSEVFLVPYRVLFGSQDQQGGVCLDAGFAFGAGFL